MRVNVKINQQGVNINETFTGADTDEVVSKMKARVARELPFVMRLAVNAMSNLMFAQEVVKRYGLSGDSTGYTFRCAMPLDQLGSAETLRVEFRPGGFRIVPQSDAAGTCRTDQCDLSDRGGAGQQHRRLQSGSQTRIRPELGLRTAARADAKHRR